MPLPTDGPVVIADYNPDWPRLYEEERARIVDALGEWLVDIEHVGSTSVPGLAAKPIVDIMPGIRSLSDADKVIERIERLGYEHLPPEQDDVPDRLYFKRGVPRTFHVHVAEVNGDFWRHHITFRDYLCAHPETAAEYEALKQRLAAQYGSDRLGYVKAKANFIRGVVDIALGTKAS